MRLVDWIHPKKHERATSFVAYCSIDCKMSAFIITAEHSDTFKPGVIKFKIQYPLLKDDRIDNCIGQGMDAVK